MKALKKIIFVTILMSHFDISHAQTNYFVSPTGNNGNAGAIGSPWKTIQYALNQLTANDTLNLFTGTYNEKINMTNNNIYLRNLSGNTPIIDATGITTQNAIISINSKSNVTIDGIELKNNIQNDAQGIIIDGNSSYITIVNCDIHDIHFSSNPSAPVNANTNAQGIIIYGDNASSSIQNLNIKNNKVHDCRLGYSEGLAVNGNVDGFEVSGNFVYNLTNIGIDIIGYEGTCSDPSIDQARNGLVKNNVTHNCISAYATSGGLYVDGGKMIIIENNTSFHNGYGMELGCENVGATTDQITARNNIFYDNEICAIAIGGYDYPTGSGKVTNSTIRNNTCYFNDYSNSGTGEIYFTYSENSIIENNIFYLSSQNTISYAELNQPSLSFNFNLFYSTAGPGSMKVDWNGNTYNSFATFQSGTGSNANAVLSNPLFVLPSIISPNFHLQSSSPAINCGNPSFVAAVGETDIDGENRINGSVDCGADEYYSTTGLQDLSNNSSTSVLPNPSTGSFVLYFSENKSHLIQLFSSSGQMLLETKAIESVSFNLDIKQFTPGLYFCIVDSEKAIKLIKQ